MAIRVYRVAVVGCPRKVIEADGSFKGVGKSCFCNRFVKPESYAETHESVISSEKWNDNPAFNCDHFLYWGATTKHLPDGSKVRFQLVEQTEFYDDGAGEGELQVHPADRSYPERASSVRVATSSPGKVGVRLKAEQASVRAGGVTSTTQLFPNDDFGGKNGGLYGYVCIFDPTLEEEQMKRQTDYLTELLQVLNRRKKKIMLVCTKCDSVDETLVRHASNLAAYALKRPLPFFEVSSRETVNVEDVLLMLIGHPRKQKLPKLPKSPKLPKQNRHYSQNHVTYKEAVLLRKHDAHHAKSNYRQLLQQKITNFSSTWNEVYPSLEKEGEFSLLLQLAGKEMVRNMFCLRLIEIKLTEGAKLFKVSTANKKLNQENLREYQEYLSSALKNHPDLRNESAYDYVYSPSGPLATNSLPIQLHHGNSSSSDSSLATSSTPTQQNTPDITASLPPTPARLSEAMKNGHSRSVTIQSPGSFRFPSESNASLQLGNRSSEFIPTLHPPPTPPHSSRRSRQGVGSRLPPLPSRLPTSQSHPLLDPSTHPPSPTRRKNGRAGGSVGAIAGGGGGWGEKIGFSSQNALQVSTEAIDAPIKEEMAETNEHIKKLDAEPYLYPIELKTVLHALSHQGESDLDPFRSVREHKPTHRPPLPALPFGAAGFGPFDTLQLTKKNSARSFGHRRTASNPWILERSRDSLPPVPPPVPKKSSLPPPVPPRGVGASGVSPSLTLKGLKDIGKDGPLLESSLEFTTEVRRSVVQIASPIPPVSPCSPMASKSEIVQDGDNLSTISGPFEEIPDGMSCSSSSHNVGQSHENSLSPSGLSKTLPFLHTPTKKKVSLDDSDYEKIEEYMVMAPSPATYPRRSPAPETSASAATKAGSPQRNNQKNYNPSARSSALITQKLQKTKKGKKCRQSADPIEEGPVRCISPSLLSSKRFTTIGMFGSSMRSSVPPPRPLPPSPTKPAKGVSRNESSVSNIYETIDDELISRVRRRRKGAGFLRWGPPVPPQNEIQYLVVVEKFFQLPYVSEMWNRTVQEVMPGAKLGDFPPPFMGRTYLRKADEEEEDEEEEEEEIVVEERKARVGAPPVLKKHITLSSIYSNPLGGTTDDIIPVTVGSEATPLSPPQLTQVQQEVRQVQSTPSSPSHSRALIGGFSPSSRFAQPQRIASREDVIEMLNLSSFNQGESSESESSESEEEEEEEEDGSEEEEEEGSEEEEEEERREEVGGSMKSKEEAQEGNEEVEEEEEEEEEDKIMCFPRCQLPMIPPLSGTTATDFDSIIRSSVSTDSDLDSLMKLVATTTTTHKRDEKTNLYSAGQINGEQRAKGKRGGRGGRGGGVGCREDGDLGEGGGNSGRGEGGGEVEKTPRRAPSSRRGSCTEGKNLSDSGISNCHSQAYEDGFHLIDAA